mgnify:CR=1 FL=1
MSAAVYDFTIEQGTTHRMSFLWEDSEGAPINLTDYTARMQARKAFNADEKMIAATTENGMITLIPLTGEVQIELPEDITTTFIWPQALYDLELVSLDGTVTRLVQGLITISREVTRSV